MIKIIYDIYSLLFQFYFLLNLVVKVSLDWLDSRCFFFFGQNFLDVLKKFKTDLTTRAAA